MLSRRLASTAVLVTVMVLLVWLDFWLATDAVLGRAGVVLVGLSLIVGVVTAVEFSGLWSSDAGETPKCQSGTVMAIGTALMIAVASIPALWRDYPADCAIGYFGWTVAGIIAGLLVSFFAEARKFGGSSEVPGAVAGRIGLSVLVYVYLAMLFGFILPIRNLEHSNSLGLLAVILLIATVKASDGAAYFAGKSLGKRKLAPALSPGKTIEGSLAAPLGGCFAAAIVIFAVAPLIFGMTVNRPWWFFIAYGVVVTLAGMLGDLAESLLKRDAQIKDSGSMIPGLGGLLDVLDSLVFAAPVSFLIWVATK